MLALFIISMFRVLPSFNRILAAFNSIRFNYSTINNINEEIISYKESLLTQRDEIIINNIDFKKNIVLENIFFSFPNNKKNILQDINLTINKGNYIGLVGDSGSGKSTLLNILCGLINPISGYVKVDGRFVRDNLKSFQKKIGYVPQKIYLTDDTFDKNIVLGVDKANFNNDLLGKVIVQSKLENVINNFSEGIHTKIGEYGSRLSGGQQQRIGIARALYKQPEIIIFDEATSALDPKVEEDILDTIYGLKNNITVIIVSHKDSVMSRCDHVYKLDNGRLLKI
jgi:ABC-type bacteriocin/lantibiotic exporter with double-glycine peptidase domain